jgi:hypothetical protein
LEEAWKRHMGARGGALSPPFSPASPAFTWPEGTALRFVKVRGFARGRPSCVGSTLGFMRKPLGGFLDGGPSPLHSRRIVLSDARAVASNGADKDREHSCSRRARALPATGVSLLLTLWHLATWQSRAHLRGFIGSAPSIGRSSGSQGIVRDAGCRGPFCQAGAWRARGAVPDGGRIGTVRARQAPRGPGARAKESTVWLKPHRAVRFRIGP